jgi:peptidoglycan/LPS O-acetylase OafA/YrhL
VAAVLVVLFHTFEAWNGGSRFIQIMNHGYLAVDFFFLLSGFVVAYAYDDRWASGNDWICTGGMTLSDFFKRRLIRLQPMVIAGNIVGAGLFYFQQGSTFPLIAATPPWKMLLVMLVGFTMLPLPPAMDIRGWQETYPLDGPGWSLMYEYIANILYAVGLRKLSNKALGVLVILSAALLVQYAVFGGRGDVIGGWALDEKQMHVGFARMLYPFFAGILLMRLGKRIQVRGAFGLASLLLIVIFWIPRIGGTEHLWMNGLYESFAILAVFPVIVMLGAGGQLTGAGSSKTCRFLGDLSYPLYITHYGWIYWYTAWVAEDKPSLKAGVKVGAALILLCITIAYACAKLYDEPVRAWLQSRFLTRTLTSTEAAPAITP